MSFGSDSEVVIYRKGGRDYIPQSRNLDMTRVSQICRETHDRSWRHWTAWNMRAPNNIAWHSQNNWGAAWSDVKGSSSASATAKAEEGQQENLFSNMPQGFEVFGQVKLNANTPSSKAKHLSDGCSQVEQCILNCSVIRTAKTCGTISTETSK